MKQKRTAPDTSFLFEIGTLRHIQRTWRQFLNPDMANLAEHHFRVAWTALTLAKMEGVTNTEKVLKMALVHDVAESRTGDVNYIQRQYVERAEDMALQDIFADTVLEEEFIQLMKEYEERKSIEAKIVKDADNLDVDFELQEQEYRGYVMSKEWKTIRKSVADTKLYTKSAKKLWKQIVTTSPHLWHIEGRNRFTSGDWKEKKTK